MAGPNRDFFELVKAIGESKSKQEEDRIISEEVIFLKKKIPETGVSKKKMKEYVIRAVYVELLGQDASFAYIKAVELCASSNIIQKRVGYLASALCFSPDHEFRFMLVNQIQRDMNSSNHLETCSALTAVCKIVTADMVPAVIGDVIKLLKHEMEVVRKKAVCALHRLYQMDSSCIIDHVDKVRRILCDRDPSVMGSSLILLHALIAADPIPFKDLVSSFVSILKQIIEHRLPREFDYHRIPAPWIQLHILRILSLLGRGDQSSSEGMYEVLVDVMRRADTGINVGYAIVYECVRTITTIYPNPLLLDAAATAISRFIRSDSHNLKYIGIKGLAIIVKDHPKYAADHQMAVIDCLEDPDETLKRKTLDLLFRMTNSVNVEFIVEKLLSFLATATDDHFRTDLVGRITQCAERFAPSNSWFVNTVVRVFELAGDKVKMSVAQTLMQLIAEGSEVEEENETGERKSFDDELRTHAVEDFLALLQKPAIPDVLAQAMAWILGEYGYLSQSQTPELIMINLLDLCRQTTDSSTRCYTITALMKLVAQCGVCPPVVQNLVNTMAKSNSLEVVQRSIEFQSLLASGLMADVLPVDASLEDIEVDPDLAFLNNFVQTALNSGAAPYSPPSHLGESESISASTYTGQSTSSGFKIGPYEKPTIPVASQNIIGLSAASAFPENIPTLTPVGAPISSPAAPPGNQMLAAKGVAQVWGRKPEPVSAQTQFPVATPAASTNPQVPVVISPVYTPTHVAPPVDAPRAPSEKEKMAAALFGGIPGTSGASNSSHRRGSATTSAHHASTQNRRGSAPLLTPATPPQVQQSVNNEFGLETTVTAQPPAVQVPPPATNVFDLLDMGSTLPTPPQSQQSVPPAAVLPAAAPPRVNLMNSGPTGVLFDDLVTITQTTELHKSPATTLSVHDAFSDLMGSSSSSVSLTSLGPELYTPRVASYSPIRLTTAEFGNRWGHTPHETKRIIRVNTIRSLDQLSHVLTNAPTPVSHVESIPTTSEAIFATTLACSILSPQAPLGSLLLIHTKIIPQRGECMLTVKAASKELGEELLNLLAMKL